MSGRPKGPTVDLHSDFVERLEGRAIQLLDMAAAHSLREIRAI